MYLDNRIFYIVQFNVLGEDIFTLQNEISEWLFARSSVSSNIGAIV